MPAHAIEVENLCKNYRLGQFGAGSLREDLSAWWRRRRGMEGAPDAQQLQAQYGERVQGKTFHALRDVSFTVEEGEVLGIIGSNGAGKSTLLKILSRITEPTAGLARMRGRLASLLEVGTGFHPDLTGRENIFLNGAIMGLNRAEVHQRFDQIVEFAGVQAFLDTPVKRYSSGMHVRLGFAVAAHLEPDILIVDEVLAVGDRTFRHKCLGRMREVSRSQGRTVLFVSHDMPSVRELCGRCLYLRDGRVAQDGPTKEVLRHYYQDNESAEKAGRPVSGTRFLKVSMHELGNAEDAEATTPLLTAPGMARLVFEVQIESSEGVNLGFSLIDAEDRHLYSSVALDFFPKLPSGRSRLSLTFPTDSLKSGDYRIGGTLWDAQKRYDHAMNLCSFTILETQSTRLQTPAFLHLPAKWEAPERLD
jgi:lipopolysaccharide transport system ATP-binding protein